MKFWTLLRWLSAAAFLGLWLLSCVSAPVERGTSAQPHAAPAFQH